MNSTQARRLPIAWRLILISLALFHGPIHGHAQQLTDLKVGHWVEVRGELTEDGYFSASQVNLIDPESEEVLIGSVQEVSPERDWILLLNQRVTLSRKTKFSKLSPRDLLGRRIKAEGHYRNENKFSGRKLSARGAGRDRLVGRIDSVQENAGALELSLMNHRVKVPAGTELVLKKSFSQYRRSAAPQKSDENEEAQNEGLIVRVDEDYLPGSFRISEHVQIGLRAEYSRDTERDYDLDGGSAADRIDDEFSLRAVGIWSPSEAFFMRLAGRFTNLTRKDEADGRSIDNGSSLTEIYGYWSRVFDWPLDIQVGRQDYYDEREWLWDENLDALRFFYHPGNWIIELAAATRLTDSSPREENTDRFILNVSRQWSDRMLGAYLIDQRTNLNGRDYPLFAGLRAYGEWLPDQKSWAELAMVRGYTGQTDVRGWGLDLGTTWAAPEAKPWYFSAGYAFGSGDGDSSDGVDHAFRQTGIQDNNDKFGGVTSFKYYGELFEPELSNLHILTAGIGRKFGRRHSVDLIYHYYLQDDAFNRLRDSNLDLRPNGTDTALGHEFDLIFGHRSTIGLDTEIVLSAFEPGSAFDDAQTAYFVKLQFRYRVR